jgi:dihydroorotase
VGDKVNLRIENGRVIDPANKVDKIATVVIEGGKIRAIEKPSGKGGKNVFDATGMIVCPGLIDMHVHLRDPGQEYKEDITSGSEAAVYGGFTTLACMPNTDPVNDTPTVTEFMINRANEVGLINLYPIAAISKGLQGKELSEFSALRKAGAVAFSDDGMPTSSTMMRRALEYASQFNLPIIDHCEDPLLTKEAVMHEGEVSAILGLKGWPQEAESIVVYRNIQLAAKAHAHVHIAHVSTAESALLIAAGKRAGVRVTAEVTPHHLYLDDELLYSFDTNLKVNPPLRPKSHVKALRKALKQGDIEVIATDHAPHAGHEKHGVLNAVPCGMLGLQTALSLVFELCDHIGMELSEMISKMTVAPAKVLNLPHGTLSVGADADVTIFDPKAEYIFSEAMIVSKSKNSPYLGRKLKGRVVRTILRGRTVYSC